MSKFDQSLIADDLSVETIRDLAVLPQWATPVKSEEERNNLYAEMMHLTKLRDEMIFYESMSGARVMDNPYALFNFISGRSDSDRRLLHIWSATRPEVIPAELLGRTDVVFVRRHSPIYMLLLASARHVIGNSVLPKYFVRKQGQKYLNTWHGIGYKTLGRSDKNPFGAGLSVTNMLQATHVISPCNFMTETLIYGFSLRGPFSGELAETGYPRIDTTLLALDRKAKESLHAALGTHPDKPTVLFAPTWRGDVSAAERQIRQVEKDLLMLSRFDANVIFLGHHIMARHLKELSVDGVVLPSPNMNTNQLLAIADVLITDYSSIFFDYLVTGRPVIHYLYDYRTYAQSRGLTLALEELPGAITFDSVGLQNLVNAALEGNLPVTERYELALRRFCPFDDGNVSERVSQWFLQGDKSVQKVRDVGTRRKIAFWGGHLADEATLTEFLEELRNCANSGTAEVTLIISRQATKVKAAKDLLRSLGGAVSVVVRDAHEIGMTETEAEARSCPASERTTLQARLYKSIYQREYSRIFGEAKFDEVVLDQGLSHFWKQLSSFSMPLETSEALT